MLETPYDQLDEDFRDTWRDHPVTIAFLETVRSHRSRLSAALVASAKDAIPNVNSAILIGGQIRALDFVMDLPGRARRG